VATILVQDGTLHIGDTVIAGPILGKVRGAHRRPRAPVKVAGPSTPVEVLGLAALPQPGDSFQAINDAAKARQVALFRQAQVKEKVAGAKASRLTLESLQAQIAEGDVKELPIIIKAGRAGLRRGARRHAHQAVGRQGQDADHPLGRRRHQRVGRPAGLSSNAIIIGFSVRPDRNAAEVAEREHVDLRLHSIIYNVIDEMKKAMTGLLEPTFRRSGWAPPRFGRFASRASARWRAAWSPTARSSAAATRQARLLRDHVVVFEGKIARCAGSRTTSPR